jgi:hypothetical protein
MGSWEELIPRRLGRKMGKKPGHYEQAHLLL